MRVPAVFYEYGSGLLFVYVGQAIMKDTEMKAGN